MAVNYKEDAPDKTKGQTRQRKKGKLEPIEEPKAKTKVKTKTKAKAKSEPKKSKAEAKTKATTDVKAKTTMSKTKDKELIASDYTEEVVEKGVAVLPGSVTFSLGVTKQTEPFEFIRVDISVTKPSGTTEQELDDTLEFCSSWCDAKLEDMLPTSKTATVINSGSTDDDDDDEVLVEDEEDEDEIEDEEDSDEEDDDDDDEDDDEDEEDDEEDDEEESKITMVELREAATEAIDNHGKKFALQGIIECGGKDKGTVRRSLATVELTEYPVLVAYWEQGPDDSE